MSEHSDNGATTIRPSKHGHGDGGGGGGKWLLGALAAVVLVGGGYFAWKAMSPRESDLDVAYNDTYDAEGPLRASPMSPADDPTEDAEIASADDGVAAPASAPSRASAPARRPSARADDVPEETVGITPISASSAEYASTDESESVIVRAPRRPVWTARPSERRLTSLYPTRALERGREGEARLHCTVLDGGSLDCARVEETSATFGAAAVRVARQYRHSTTLADGRDAVGTPVNMRVVFRIEEEGRGGRFASR